MKSKKIVEHQIANLELAAFLISRNHFLEKTLSENSRFIFIFKNSPQLLGDIADFTSGAGLVSVRSLFSAYSRVKDLLWVWRRAGGKESE